MMYELIQKASLRLPSFLSFQCRDVIKGLLRRDPTQRLGHGPPDADPIKAHPFFTGLDFGKLVRKEIQPPFVPTVKGATDTSNFDAEFTSEKVVDSVVPQSALAAAKGA